MVVYHGRSKRTKTGAKRHPYKKKKKKALLGRQYIPVTVGKTEKKIIRVMGGNTKVRLKSAEFANVLDPETKQYKKVKILSVLENTADRNFARRNIITKGAIIETELGKAKVVSRPGQDGVINAILVK